MSDKLEYIPPPKDLQRALLLVAEAQLELAKQLGRLSTPVLVVRPKADKP